MENKIIIPNFISIEEAVSFGLQIREKVDGLQWLFGDYAVIVVRALGQNALEEVAKQIGVQTNTMRRYRDMALKFPPEIRERYKKLSWTHFRNVYTLDKPEVVLEKADSENWSVDKTVVFVKNKGILPVESRPKICECVECGNYFLIGPKICISSGRHSVQ